MPSGLRPVDHEDLLSVVGHLDELRTRLIVSGLAVVIAFGFCFWQNHRLLQLIDSPLAHQTQQQVRDGHGPLGATYLVQQSARDLAVQLSRVAGVLRAERPHSGLDASLGKVQSQLKQDVSRLSAPPHGDRPVTLGIGEPFTTTLTVSLIFALILSLPVLLHQVYAFLMPALDPRHRRRMLPMTLAVPFLFIAGVAFGYVVVLPAAVHFFQNFNSGQFNVLVQASQYYKFAATTMLAMGLLFEVPVAILAVTSAGVITPRQLRSNRRYAIGACALVAAVLPGDAITMLLETVPLYLLFELGVLFASFAERRQHARERREANAAAASDLSI
ncbi:MAG: twin-arginine translocase subunit TatC [Solirubrobacteraceae bacterium]